jgi:hypothetical protein
MREPRAEREGVQHGQPDSRPPHVDDGPSPLAGAGDLAGLLDFLSWMKVNASRFDKSPRSVGNSQQIWLLAMNRLGLADDIDIDAVDLADVAKRMVLDRNFAGRDADRTMRVYAGRLAIGREWHQRWRAKDPEWSRRTYLPNPALPRQSQPASTFVYPLARGREVLVKVPADLSSAEADALCAWVATLART